MSDLFSSLLIFTIIKTILSTLWALIMTEVECSVAGTTTLDREWGTGAGNTTLPE